MNEEFLHYIWQHKLYYPTPLKTTSGQSVEVIHPGIKNSDGGPDFFNAKIKIDNTLWAGNVEIHQVEAEWYQHKHHEDAAYNNVILHVVKRVSNGTHDSNHRPVSVCQLSYPDDIQQRYQQMYFNTHMIPCAPMLSHVNPFHLSQWLNRLLIEKLEEKTQHINELLLASKHNWDQVFFIMLARSFGFGLNGLPFEMMARQTNLTILLKHADHLFQLEALLFGQAGFLTAPKYSDDYTQALSKEYAFLKHKYQLQPIDQHLWKFLRLRPSNFPTIRLAQLAGVIYRTKGQFSSLLKIISSNSLINLLTIDASDYWQTHYQLGRTSKKRSKRRLGQSSQQRIVYNTIIPYLFIYASKHNNYKLKEKTTEYLYEQPPEKNTILTSWEKYGIKIENEGRAQALIFLKNRYCTHKKCLNCHIGHDVLCRK